MPSKIFVNYRRDDDAAAAARVRDGLAAKFGKANVFMDVDNLLAGQRFDIKLAEALDACDVLIAVMGERWMGILRERTAAIEADPNERDYVRQEIAAALKRGIVVIPVRVGRDGKLPPLPRASELPADICDLVAHQKHDVRHETHGRDVADLIEAIRTVRREALAQQPRRMPWRWVGGTASVAFGIGSAAAYFGGVPMPWTPGSPTNPAVVSREQKSLIDPAVAAKRERDARAKTEAEAKRLADLAAQEIRDREAREKAAARCASVEVDVAGRGKVCLDPAKPDSREFQDCFDVNGKRMCGPKMVVIPKGRFLMGSSDAEIAALIKEYPTTNASWFRAEAPEREVTIGQPFAVGLSHVTRGEFRAFVTATGREPDGGCWAHDGKEWKRDANRSWLSPGFEQDDSHPVVCVDWYDARAYAAWLKKEAGQPYRLLTEAEAEYVARGVTTAARQPRYYFGNSPKDLCRNGNGADLTGAETFSWDKTQVAPCEDGFAATAPAGSPRFATNPFGVRDVHGNAWSWTEDCYANSYNDAPADGSARPGGNCVSRVIRGGSWVYLPQLLRAAVRFRYREDDRFYDLGFRLARTLLPSP